MPRYSASLAGTRIDVVLVAKPVSSNTCKPFSTIAWATNFPSGEMAAVTARPEFVSCAVLIAWNGGNDDARGKNSNARIMARPAKADTETMGCFLTSLYR